MRVNDRRGRAKVSPAPRPLDTSTQREGVSPLNQYTVSPEVLRSLKAGLPPRRRPAFPKIKPWEERTPRAREKLTASVRSFQAWRRAQGELLPSDPWSAPPPTLQRLGEYLQTLQGRSSSWRTYSAQARRMYRFHVGKPELADVVWLPRHRKDA